MANIGWVIIFIQFNQMIGNPVGHSSISQETEFVYQSLKECSGNVLNIAHKKFPDQNFGVAYYGKDKDGIIVTTLAQSSSVIILHHKFICLEIKGFE